MKPTTGMTTSEFYLTVVVVLASLVLAVTGSVEGSEALTAITGAGAAYGISRGLAKRNVG